MMSAIDNYGELEVPEEKTEIEVIEDPTKTIASSYQIFCGLGKKRFKGAFKYGGWSEIKYCKTDLEDLYQIAIDVLKDKEKLRYNYADLKPIFELLKPKQNNFHVVFGGIFLSALHNIANTDAILFNEKNKLLCQLGYRLKENKTLVVGHRVYSDDVGTLSQGNIINLGMVERLGRESYEGRIINYGFVCSYLSLHGENAVRINNNFVREFRYHDSCKALVINAGVTADEYVPEKVINLNRKLPLNLHFSQPENDKFLLRNKLEEKLKDAECLEKLKYVSSEDEIIKIASEFDFNKFEKELREVAKGLKRYRK